MKRFIIFFFILITLGGIYNFSIIRNSFYGYFGDLSYRNTDFSNAQKQYAGILGNHPSDTLLPADIFYNLGNALYRLGEKEKENERRNFWKKSVESYTKSLSIRADKETEENLAFVKEKLQAEEEREQKKQKEIKKEETKTGTGERKSSEQTGIATGTGGENKESRTGSGKSQTSSGQNWANQGSYNPVGGGQNANSLETPLSDTDQEEVRNYMDSLKKFAKQNGKLLNPEQGGDKGSIPEQIRNFFGNDSFFQEIMPTNDGKKDW